MYAEPVKYEPLFDLTKIPKTMWVDYEFAKIKNALHKYYCTGNREDFENREVWNSHYNLLLHKFKQKELDEDECVELTVKLATKIFLNILDKGFQVHPGAYTGYLDNAVKYCLIDHIRKKQHKPLIILFENPSAIAVNWWSNSGVHDPSHENEMDFTPEEACSIKDTDKNLFSLIRLMLSKMIVEGGMTLTYLCYHWYIHHDRNIFRGLSDRQTQVIQLVTNMVNTYLPYSKYKSSRNRMEEFNV